MSNFRRTIVQKIENRKVVFPTDNFQYGKIIEELASVSVVEGDISLQIYTAIVVKYLERVADHSVNICEWIIYIANGYHKDASII